MYTLLLTGYCAAQSNAVLIPRLATGVLKPVPLTQLKPAPAPLIAAVPIGTPVATATPSATPVVPAQMSAPVVSNSLAQWLYTLRMCESSGNYAENTDNGFYGAYQFTIDTWNHWDTGYARADLAPAAVQDATIVKNTLATQGLQTQNPGCYAKGKLTNFPPN